VGTPQKMGKKKEFNLKGAPLFNPPMPSPKKKGKLGKNKKRGPQTTKIFKGGPNPKRNFPPYKRRN